MIHTFKNIFLSTTLLLLTLLISTSISLADTIITNGTFDNAFTGWTRIAMSGSPNISIGTASNCYAGQNGNPAASFDVFGNRKGAIEQTVTLPAGASYTLSLREWGQYQATTVNVIIRDQNSVSTTLDTFIAEQLISGYTFPGPVFQCTGKSPVQKSYDISQYAGQTITIHIDATSSGNDGTFAVIDDVTITSSTTGGNNGGGNNGSGTRRPTKISLFCNRSGVNLGTATCSATVADAGPQPVSLPSGLVNFAATNGFFPGAASCFVQQTAYSPGIGSCQAQFQVPDGFPIGAQFPIDATYEGDTNFQPSTTSHKLIIASCVSTPEKPCRNSVGIDFEDTPRVVKDAINALLSCGGGKATRSNLRKNPIKEKIECVVNASGSAELASVLDRATPQLFRFIASKITASQISMVPALENLKNAARNLTDDQLSSVLKSESTNALGSRNRGLEFLLEHGRLNPTLTGRNFEERKSPSSKKSKASISIKVFSAKTTLKANSQKRVRYKLTKQGKVLVKLFRSANYKSIPVKFAVQTSRSDLKGVKKRTNNVAVELQ